MTAQARLSNDLPLSPTLASSGARARRIGLAAAVILVAGWSGLWLLASRMALTDLHNWLAHERALGRVWTCGDPRVGGFPFDVAIDCAQPSFSGPTGAQRIAVQAAALRLSMAVYRPGVLRIDLTGPLQIERPEAPPVRIAWRHMRASVRLAPATRRNVSVAAEDFEASAGVSDWRANEVRIDATPAQGLPDAEDVTVVAKGALAPELAQLLNSAKPADFSIAARTLKVDALLSDPSARSLEAWRDAGGALAIAHSVLTQDGSKIEASGELKLDAQHRLEGQLQTQGSGVDALLAKFGAPQGAGSVAALVGGLFGGGGGSVSTLSLPLLLGGGRLSVGPFLTTIRLEPIY